MYVLYMNISLLFYLKNVANHFLSASLTVKTLTCRELVFVICDDCMRRFVTIICNDL